MNYNWKILFSSKEEALSATQNGRVSKQIVGDSHICIVQDQGNLIAFEDRCPHQGKSFAGGKCEDGLVECPVHKFKFKLNSDSKVRSLNFIPLKLKEEGVFAGIKKGFW
jgi:nitrite reductase/ring-hydroxylating ferredoxin subunit